METTEATPLIVFVTAPDQATARALARRALTQRLVACANIVPQVESHYWWDDKLESAAEHLIIFKTTTSQLSTLQDLITTEHPYDVPEFIAIPLQDGNPDYLNWIRAECIPPTKP